MIVGRGGTTAVSDLLSGHGLAGTAGPQRTITKRGNPRAPARGRRVTPPGAQTATVVGGPSGVRGVDPVAVPRWSAASTCHPRHDPALAPGVGEATLDSASRPPTRRPTYGTAAAPVGAATGCRELLVGVTGESTANSLGLATRVGPVPCGRFSSTLASIRPAPRRAQLAAIPAGTSPRHAGHRLLLRRHPAPAAVICAVRGRTRDSSRVRSRSHCPPEWCLGCSAGAELSEGPRRPRISSGC